MSRITDNLEYPNPEWLRTALRRATLSAQDLETIAATSDEGAQVRKALPHLLSDIEDAADRGEWHVIVSLTGYVDPLWHMPSTRKAAAAMLRQHGLRAWLVADDEPFIYVTWRKPWWKRLFAGEL